MQSATQDKAASTAIIKGLQEAVGDIIKTLEKRTILHEEGTVLREYSRLDYGIMFDWVTVVGEQCNESSRHSRI